MQALPTVKILHPEHPDGVIINESDLTDEHVLLDTKAENTRRKKTAAKAETPAAVTKQTETPAA